MIILITGATSGFGKATAEKFAANGWHCIITGRRVTPYISTSAPTIITRAGLQFRISLAP